MSEAIVEVKSNKYACFSCLHYVTKIVPSTTESAFRFDLVKATGEAVMATDGHRLHVFDGPEWIKPGYYKVLKSNTRLVQMVKEAELDDERIFWPETEPLLNMKGGKPLYVPKNVFKDITMAQVIRAMPDGMYLNIRYLQEAMDEDIVSVVVRGKKQPVTIKGEHTIAVIMPFVI